MNIPKETLQPLKLMSGFTRSMSERHTNTWMLFIPKRHAIEFLPSIQFAAIVCIERRQGETSQTLYMGQRWTNEFHLAMGQTQPTQHGWLLRLSRNINLRQCKKAQQNKTIKTPKYKNLSFHQVHWNLHTPTGKAVQNIWASPFLSPAGQKLLLSSCRSLPRGSWQAVKHCQQGQASFGGQQVSLQASKKCFTLKVINFSKGREEIQLFRAIWATESAKL